MDFLSSLQELNALLLTAKKTPTRASPAAAAIIPRSESAGMLDIALTLMNVQSIISSPRQSRMAPGT